MKSKIVINKPDIDTSVELTRSEYTDQGPVVQKLMSTKPRLHEQFLCGNFYLTIFICSFSYRGCFH